MLATWNPHVALFYAKHLSAADYGGDSLEGCPEVLAVTRPDVTESFRLSVTGPGANALLGPKKVKSAPTVDCAPGFGAS